MDEIDLRHDDVVEEALAELLIAVDQLDRSHRDARIRHREEDETDAFPLGHIEVRSDEAEHPVRVMRARGPDLRAVHKVVVALVLGARLQGSKVRTGVRLGIALAPTVLAARDLGKMARLLVLGAVFEQCRTDHGETVSAEGKRRPRREHLFSEHVLLVGGHIRAAVFLRPGGGRVAVLEARLGPTPRVVGIVEGGFPTAVVDLARASQSRRQVFFDPRARLGAKFGQCAHASPLLVASTLSKRLAARVAPYARNGHRK